MKIRKILAAFVSVVTICSVISVPTFAAQETQIVTDLVSPAYEYAMSTKSYLTITSSTAECKSVCDGMAGVTQITVEHTLEKHWGLWIWNEVDGASWTKTVYSDTIRLSNTKSGLDSGTYRLKSVFTLKSSSGDTEKITVYSDEKTVG
jgi:hypothetical protein